jgi:hypothetical protein
MVYQDYPDHLDLKANQVYQEFQAFQDQKASQVPEKLRFSFVKKYIFVCFLRLSWRTRCVCSFQHL